MPSKLNFRTLALAAGALAVAGGTLATAAPAEAKDTTKDRGRVCILMTKMFPPQCLKWKPAPKPPKKHGHHHKHHHKHDTKEQKERRPT